VWSSDFELLEADRRFAWQVLIYGFYAEILSIATIYLTKWWKNKVVTAQALSPSQQYFLGAQEVEC
jgi:hypothetical protein